MPSASLDCDEKYTKLLNSYQDLCLSKIKSNNNNDRNNNDILATTISNKSSCKLFDNILESLIWLTENKDKNLLSQILSSNNSQQHSTADYFSSVYIEENKEVDEEEEKNNQQQKKTNVLITGSLYLVGLTLKVLNFKTD